MASPVVESRATSQEGGATTTSHTVTLPSGIASGDLVIVVFHAENDVGITWPGGWVELSSTANNSRTETAYLEASGGETSITVTTDAGTESAHCSLRVSGAEDPDTQAPEVGTIATGNSTAPDPGSVSPTGGSKDYLFVAWAGSRNGATFSAYPAGYSNGQTIESDAPGPTASCATAELATTASSEDPGSFTVGLGRAWIAGAIAVHPPAAGGGGSSANSLLLGVG